MNIFYIFRWCFLWFRCVFSFICLNHSFIHYSLFYCRCCMFRVVLVAIVTVAVVALLLLLLFVKRSNAKSDCGKVSVAFCLLLKLCAFYFILSFEISKIKENFKLLFQKKNFTSLFRIKVIFNWPLTKIFGISKVYFRNISK